MKDRCTIGAPGDGVLIVGPIRNGRREVLQRGPMAAAKWQPARDFGERHIMRMQLPIISRASPMLLLCSVKLDQSRFD